MIDIVGKKRVLETKSMIYWIDQYNLFTKCRNLGIKFGPKDITAEQVEIFAIIKETIEDSENKGKK